MKGYWVICIESYNYEGIEIPKGRMTYHQSLRPIVSDKWRKANKLEVDTRLRYEGNWYNLVNV